MLQVSIKVHFLSRIDSVCTQKCTGSAQIEYSRPGAVGWNVNPGRVLVRNWLLKAMPSARKQRHSAFQPSALGDPCYR